MARRGSVGLGVHVCYIVGGKNPAGLLVGTNYMRVQTRALGFSIRRSL